MAFDQPLEADKVEGNLLVSLVRGPILGTLMWMIGDDENEKKQQEEELRRGLQDMIILDDVDKHNNEHSSYVESRMDVFSSKPNTLPRMVRSDLSVAGDHNPQETFPLPLQSSSSNNDDKHLSRAEKKKMSWSENLVEYMDGESIRHEPPSAAAGSPSGIAKPIKSAMTRAASIRSHALAEGPSDGDDKERKIRYLPSGLDRAHNGLIMPTRPMGNDPHGAGIESPQWGWYINTTPPTPEMYHSRSSLKHSEKSDQTSTSTASSDRNTYDTSAVRGPNRVFQGLKAGSNRPPVGWPSVPL